jgi:D-amino-acid dehydrogenase
MKHIVVVGGGVIGLTSAWALLEAGQRVTLVERSTELAGGASRANGGQLSYRYVSPLADAGVPLKAMRWLMDPDGPLRFRLEAKPQQWSWLAQFLAKCRAPVNRVATERLLRLGAFSQQTFADWQAEAHWDGIALREPGKLVVYRNPTEFDRVRRRSAQGGTEQALDAAACVALEPALAHAAPELAGGIFTPGEAVADCHALCQRLGEQLRAHPRFGGLLQAQAQGFVQQDGRVTALRTDSGQLAGDSFVIAAGLHSRQLAATVGLSLPLYPLKGYSLTAPIGPGHRPPEVSVTDFEKKILYARIDQQLRIAAMVDLVGDDESLDTQRLASLHRAVRQMFPDAADYAAAVPWAGLRPATPGGVPILGPTRLQGLWLNVGHGALGFTFSFGSARVLASLMAGQHSPLPLDGLLLPA